MAAKRPKISDEQKAKCRLITPEFRVSYPHLFEAHAMDSASKKKFSVTMLFPKDAPVIGQTLDGKPRKLASAMKAAKLAYFGSEENIPEDLESPITDGDVAKKGKEIAPGYAGHWAVRASTGEDQRPGIVDAKGIPITEASVLYPGCYARAYIYAYVWEFGSKQGVGFILDHIQKLRDGKSFGGKKPVEQVFAPIVADEDDADADEDADFL